MGVCLVVATAVIAGRAEAQPGVGVGEQRLAHRFNQWAQELMSQGYGDEQDRVEAALTLLEAASQLDGANAEIHRLTIEAMQMSGRREGLNKTLGAYLRLVPTDDVAQLKLIGLLVDGADTVEARLLIYERLLNGRGAQSLSAALRSRVALGAALYHRETGDLKQYGQYLKQAVTLDESNPDAAFEAYLFLEERGVGRVQRANALLNVLAAAPTRSDLHIRLARLLMECGLYDAAANWFDSASWLWATEGYPDEIAMGLIVNEWALSVWGAGQPQAALNLIESFRAAGANGDDAEVLAVDLQLTQLAILSAVGRDDDVAVLFEALLKSLRPTDAATALSVGKSVV